MRRFRAWLALWAIPVIATGFTAPAAASQSAPFGHACVAENGVRFCPTRTPAERVPSFDGVPLDVDVTLPASGTGPWPTIVMMHGFGGNKTNFEAASPGGPAPDAAGNGSTIYRYNNNFYARRGYAVLTYTARGFGGSCGGGPNGDHAGPCGPGYIRLADSRYEARDTQHLLGLLADEGVTKPRAIGVTGISYGGGQSMELAFLRDKIRRPDGRLAPWRSPDGKPMRIAAAYPRWPWSDLVAALIPNGRYLDTEVAPRDQSLRPFGVPVASYLSGLYLTGFLSGYYCGGAPASAPCPNPGADITRNFAFIQAGQPLSGEARSALASVYRNSGGYPIRFLKGFEGTAPLLIQSGWTDDLFPPEHALRVYAFLRKSYPRLAPSLQLGDLGHSRGSNKPEMNHFFNDQAARFFAHHLQGARKRGPAPGSVTAFTQTCPLTAPDNGPYRAKLWRDLHPGRFGFGSGAPQEFTSAGGDPAIGRAFEPTFGTTDACKTIAVTPEPNTAVYSRAVEKGFTMLGLPTVSMRISSTGQYGQIVARLWDLSPEGTQMLISRGVYALDNSQAGELTFQLHGNGYRFAKGHTVQLELLGRDAPYYQPGNVPFTVRAADVRVELPTLQRKPR